MAWKNEYNNAKKVIQNGTFKEKAEYIWDYYKWHLVGLIVILGMIGSLIYSRVTAKECVLQGIFLNSTAEKDAELELEKNFLAFSPIDESKEEILFDASYYFSTDIISTVAENSYETLQIITAKIAAEEVDFIVGDLTSMNNIAYREYFYDLSEVLPEELMKKYEAYFLYYDRSFVEKMKNTDMTYDHTTPIVYPDPKKPELMEEPVPVFIDVSKCKNLQEIYPYRKEECLISFAVNGKNNTKALEFINFIME